MDSSVADSGTAPGDGAVESGPPPPACDGGPGDPLNCGAPVHSCQGGACVCGACQPVVLFAVPDGGPGTSAPIAVDSTSVYFCDNYACDASMCGFVYKLPKDGGAPAPLAQVSLCQGLAVDATRAYWTDTGANSIAAVSLDGGSPTTLAFGSGNPWAIAVDSTAVYWTDIGNGSVNKAPLDGGPQQPISVAATLFPEAIAVDSTGVYWTDHNAGNGGAWVAPADGGAPAMFAPFGGGGGYGAGIAVAAGEVFWAQALPDGGVQGVNELPGPTHIFVALNQPTPYGVAADTAGFYWTLYDANGGIGTMPLDGGSAATLATGQSFPQYIAVDATSIYWTTATGVMKVSKP
jgi:hypothetical protein